MVQLIKENLKDAVEIVISTKGTFIRQFKNSGHENKIQIDKFDIHEIDIHRSIVCASGDILFNLDIDFHKYPLEESILRSINSAKKIEAFLPNLFTWFFSGRGVHGHAIIKYTKDNEIMISKFGNVFKFYKQVLKYLCNALHIDLDTTFVHYKGLCRVPYSCNTKSGLYKVPIDVKKDNVQEILDKSKNRVVTPFTYRELDVRELLGVIPPPITYIRDDPEYNKIDIAWNKYPPCVNELMNEKDKGNRERYILLQYFCAIHKKSDVRKIMKQILTKDEYYHMQKEGQLEYIYNRNYSPPSCTYMVRRSLCSGCGRANPAFVHFKPND